MNNLKKLTTLFALSFYITINPLADNQSNTLAQHVEDVGFIDGKIAKVDFSFDRKQVNNYLAKKIIGYMEMKEYNISYNPGELNIVYVEGMNLDGSLNNDAPNKFNDVRLIIEFNELGEPQIIGQWEATTEPGNHFTYNKMNSKGTARIKFGQYKAWKIGVHNGDHEALIQTGGEVTVYRDLDMNFIRTGDKSDQGSFGINQHWGYDNPLDYVGKASAGCLVGRTKKGHKEFMAIIKQDRRYQQDREYVFESTIIPGDELLADKNLS